MITKFIFNSLFSTAWLSALSPANLVSGFQKCGVNPFNVEAILIPNNCVQSNSHNEESVTVADPVESALVDKNCVVDDGPSLAACFSHVTVEEPLCKCVYGYCCSFEYHVHTNRLGC